MSDENKFQNQRGEQSERPADTLPNEVLEKMAEERRRPHWLDKWKRKPVAAPTPAEQELIDKANVDQQAADGKV
jgi:hypothetical protein